MPSDISVGFKLLEAVLKLLEVKKMFLTSYHETSDFGDPDEIRSYV